MSSLLDVADLSVRFAAVSGAVEVLSKVGLRVASAEIVGIVGESGSGKSVAALAIMGLLDAGGEVTSGRILFADRDITHLSARARRQLRGAEIAMIFQEPGTSLNPLVRVGHQIAEAMTEHGTPVREAERRAVELLDRVGIPAPDLRARDYPHQLSGGTKQRIMIAMALACRPKLLIADEPTTALDVTTQAQILNLILDLRDEFAMGVMLITHDMGVIGQMADRVVVMYGGEVVETAPLGTLFRTSGHPYTRLLLKAIPSAHHSQADLPLIPGAMPSAGRWPGGCRFYSRCPLVEAACRTEHPSLGAVGTASEPGHLTRCLRSDAVRLNGALA